MVEARLRLAQVVAMGRNGAIGRDNGLLWRLRSDMRRFRQITMGHPLIMGRKTWESIGKPLPGRDTIVLSRRGAVDVEGVHTAATLEAAIQISGDCAAQRGVDAAMVVGGAEIYAATLPLSDLVYLTVVDDAPQADAFFPGGPDGAWRADFVEVGREAHPASAEDEKPFCFVDLQRHGATGAEGVGGGNPA